MSRSFAFMAFFAFILISCPRVTLGERSFGLGNGQTVRLDDTGFGGLIVGAAEDKALENWPLLCVKRCVDCGGLCTNDDLYDVRGAVSTLGDNGRSTTMSTVFLADVLVDRTVYFSPSTVDTQNGFIRFVDRFSNESDEPVTITVALGSMGGFENRGRLVSDEMGLIRTQHLDDALLSELDRWFIADDNLAEGGVPSLGVISWGGGGLHPSLLVDGFLDPNPFVQWHFELTIPAGETRALMTVLVVEPSRAQSLIEVPSLLRVTTTGVLTALSPEARNAIVNFDVESANAAPVANAGGPYQIDEGSSVAFSAVKSHDLEQQPLQYGWHFSPTDDLEAPFDATGANVSNVFLDDGLYSVRLTVTDVAGKQDRSFASVRVNNLDPSIDLFTTNSPIVEGDPLLVRIEASDPGNDDLSFSFDWEGKNTFELGLPETQRVYPEDGIYALTVLVQDGDGGFQSANSTIEVINAPPQILQVVVAPEVGEGLDIPVEIIAQDPGNDPLTYAFDKDGDGIYESDGGLDGKWQTRFDDNGFYQIRTRVCDDVGACAFKQHPVSVRNRPPMIRAIEISAQNFEGQPVTIRVDATDTEPDIQDLEYAFDFDNDGVFTDDLIQQTPQATHTFPSAGRFRIGVRVRDGDGGISTATTEVVVENLPPSAVVSGPQRGNEGERLTFGCAGQDQGDAFLAIDWDVDGDGFFERTNSSDRLEIAFGNEGSYEIGCRIRDGFGGSAIATQLVYIANVIPTANVDFGGEYFEGTEALLRVVAQDPGDDLLTYKFDFDGDGLADAEPSTNPIGRHTYFNEGVYPVTVWVSDQTDETRLTGELHVSNRPPIGILLLPPVASEGDTLTARIEASDPGGDEIFVSWDLNGDGEADEATERVLVDGVAEVEFTVDDDGPLNLSAWIRDDVGAETEITGSFIVQNVAPSLYQGYEPLPAYEQQPYTSVIPIFDPAGPFDPITYQLLSAPENVDLDSRTGLLRWTPTYEQYLESPITLLMRVSDGDNGVLETNLVIDVIPQDNDQDGLPDTYERRTCDDFGVCLDPTDPDDALEDSDNDGISNLEEWLGSTSPFVYDGPVSPILLSPTDGVRVNSEHPILEAELPVFQGNAVGDIRFEVYQDQEGMVTVLSETVPFSASEIVALQTESIPFEEDGTYYWRARTETAINTTPWTIMRSFIINAVNTAPPTPVPLSPENGVILGEASPTFTAQTVTDVDGDQVRYLFRFYRDNGEIETLGFGELDQERVRFSQPLREGVSLKWEVLAVDEVGARSEPSPLRSFTIDALNKAPTVPTLLEPEDLDLVTENPIRLKVGGTTEPDGHRFSYFAQVYSDGAEPILELFDEPNEEGVADLMTEEVIDEDRTFDLVIFAEDEFGARSQSLIKRFFLSSVDDPPSVPTPLEPLNLSPISLTEAVLIWTVATDPERASVTYRITICDGEMLPDDPSDCLIRNLVQANGIDFRDEAKPGHTYHWYVQAIDSNGNASERSTPWSFRVVDAASDQGCDCNVANKNGSPFWFVLCGMLILLWRSHTRDQG